tara:strand:+ start:35592 stop:35774 length:183 start_codon:yes stop_codon:yes gene_type:complete
MLEDFYQVYKAGRDMVETMRHKDVSDHFQNFIDSIEAGTKSLDKANPEYYTRWKKERNGE